MNRLTYPSTSNYLNYCPFCEKSSGLTHLEICSLYQRARVPEPIEGYEAPFPGYELSYPGQGPIVVFVSHAGCGPDVGYAIDLQELRKDLRGWKEHIRDKIWNTLGIMQALDYVTRNWKPQIDRFTTERPKTKPAPARPRSEIKTYLIQSEFGGHIKIGKSTHPESRLQSLQTGRPDRLLIKKIINGDKEAQLHLRFKHLREGGEWFRCEGELADFLVLQ